MFRSLPVHAPVLALMCLAMSSLYSAFIVAFFTAVISMVNSSGSLDVRLISSRSCSVKLCVKKPKAQPMDSCLLESQHIQLQSQQQRVDSTSFYFPFPETFILVTEVYDIQGVLLSSNTSKETFTIGTEFIPAVGTSDFLDIAFRSSCHPYYFGSGCQRYCKASFSHTCDAYGKKICLAGWLGEHCDQPTCPDGCKHGRCVEPGRCECDHGFFGPTCSDCRRSEKCRHGTCRDNQPFTCACEIGWGGIFCERDLEYCSRHKPCKNGGVCTNGGLSAEFTCHCPEAFVGITCEIELPSICQHPGICRNGGACTNADTKLGRCQCVKGFEGRYCERKIVQTHCVQNTCKNGGSCQGESTCVCPLCFSGDDCSVIDKKCLWHRVNVSLVASSRSDESEQTVPTRILMVMALISIMMLASCVLVFFFKYIKMKRLLREPTTQNILNERRQIRVNLPKQSIDNRPHSDDAYKVFVIPSKKYNNGTDVEKSCAVDYDRRYVTQLRGHYCALPCMDIITAAEPDHQYAEIEYRPTTVSLDDKQFTENACVV